METNYKEQVETLRKLLNGEWVDTDKVCAAMGITFSDGMKMFHFGRDVRWNKPPLNGQFVVTKFRLCEKTIKEPKAFWCEEDELNYARVNRK